MPKLLKQLRQDGVDIEYHDLSDLNPHMPPSIEICGRFGDLTYAECHTVGADGAVQNLATVQADIDARRDSVIRTLKARQAAIDHFQNLK